MAVVLSPKHRMQSSCLVRPCNTSTQMHIVSAKNSSKLIWALCRSSCGIFQRHAKPCEEYPPKPYSQASDQWMVSGGRKVSRFMLIPDLAVLSISSQSSRSLIALEFSCIGRYLGAREFARYSLDKKCRAVGTIEAVWFNLPIKTSLELSWMSFHWLLESRGFGVSMWYTFLV